MQPLAADADASMEGHQEKDGIAFQEDVQECLDAGMNAHMAKPIDVAKAEHVMAKAMGGVV